MKKLICLLIVAVLLVGCGAEPIEVTTAPAAQAAPTTTLADGTEVTFAPWEQAGLPTEGSWYLTSDVELTQMVTLTGVLQLHLNGHVVTGASGVDFGSLICVPQGIELTICEEKDGVGAIVSPRSITAKPYITHMVLVEGTMHVLGGTLDASAVSLEDRANGACVYVPEGGFLNIVDGTLIGGTVWCQSLQPKPVQVVTDTPAETTPTDSTDPTATTEATEATEPAEATQPTEPEEPEVAELLGKGGTVYLAAGGRCEMSGGIVTTGSAGLGGNFYVDAGAELIVSGGEIREGESLFNGGNLYVLGTVKISRGDVILGRAYNNGGNIFLEGTLEMTGGTLREGRCDAGSLSGKRGANLLVNGLEAVVNISNAQIIDGNGSGKENFGGNICVMGQCAREFSITDTTISGGLGHRGGNVYFGTLAKDVNPENLDFCMKNVTISDGICSYRGNNLCMDSDLRGVYVNLVMDNCTIVEENAGGETISLGAGAAVDTWATLTMTGGAIQGGSVTLYKDAVLTTTDTELVEENIGGQGNFVHTP